MNDNERVPQRVGGFDPAGRRWVVVLFGLGGAVAGAVLPYLARLASELPWFPFQGPLRLLASFDYPWLVWLRPVLGLALGLALAAWVIHGSAVLRMTARDPSGTSRSG